MDVISVVWGFYASRTPSTSLTPKYYGDPTRHSSPQFCVTDIYCSSDMLPGQMRRWTIQEHCAQLFISGLLSHWRRLPGRPRQSWTRTIEKDPSALSIGLHTAWRRAQDHEQWQRSANCGSGYDPSWGLPLMMMMMMGGVRVVNC